MKLEKVGSFRLNR